MITMIDYGGSNLRSAQKAFEAVGAAVTITTDPDQIRAAQTLVLPGVGAFGSGMDGLRQHRLIPAIHDAVTAGTPLLGICLGLQFLFDISEEMGTHDGLGLIPGRIIRFPDNDLKIPHVGWNQIHHNETHPLLANVPTDTSYAYFVHSYHCAPTNPNHIIATTDYGLNFPAIVGRDNVYGIQFHPEKSQQVGLQIIRNFIHMTS
ncbi:MAG TPA: imidazole glycerol phosphate synthase subunit HisH [Anaerolineae bacterium]|nr:imidazole glycerol phosphate synthase subunit HisH [Anaerolineae bacterium]